MIPLGTSPLAIMNGLAVLLWIFSWFFIIDKDGFLREEWLPPIVLIVVISWMGLIWTPDLHELGIKYAMKTHYWLIALAISSVDFRERPAARLIKAFLIGLALNSFAALLQLIHLLPRFAQEGATGYTGLYSGYNTLAVFLILGILIASFLFRSSETLKTKVLYSFGMALYFFHLSILEGRGGYLTFVILSPVIFYNILNGKRIYIMILAYLVVLGIMVSSPVVRNRISPAFDAIGKYLSTGGDSSEFKNYSGFDRIYMWQDAVNLFIEHPLIGVGTGGYKQAVHDSGKTIAAAHPHNNILYVAANYGILGLIAFGWLFWVLLKYGFRNRRNLTGFFVLASSLVILVGGLTDTHILDAGGASLLALTTGLISALPDRSVQPDFSAVTVDGK